tara:strand:- start:254 stop:418 length:165 start_codon:yes stop_codon:yes gene_type:complete
MISVIKYAETAKTIIDIKKSRNNTLENKANAIPKMMAVNWVVITALDRSNEFIW